MPSKRAALRRLLILDCDARKLEAQGLALGRELARNKVFLGDFQVTYVAVDDESSLRREFAAMGRRRFHAVVVVGHSNATGIRVAADRVMSWTEFARKLARYRPDKVLLLACQAGGVPVAQDLFGAIKSLRRVYGCPLNLPSNQAAVVIQTVPLILSGVDLSEGVRNSRHRDHRNRGIVITETAAS